MTWEEINRKRLPYIRLGERLFKSMFDNLRKQLIDELKKAQDVNNMTQIAHDINLDYGAVQLAMEQYYSKTAGDWAKLTAKNTDIDTEQKQEGDWMPIILEYVRTKKGKGIESIIRTHGGDIENIVRQAVELGIKEGYGMEQIARNISKAQGKIDLWKALRIARTEVVNASNEGVKIGASELAGNKQKIWISTFDNRSRDDHMVMDGVKVPMNEMFTLPSGSQLEYPGDADGPPEDIINCRCGYEIIVEQEIY